MGSGFGSGSPAITNRQRRTRSPISEAFQSPHTPGPVASASASASTCSSSSSTASPSSASTTAAMVLGSCRSRRVVRQQQVMAHDLRQQFDVRRPQTQPGADLGGQFGTDDAVVPAAALADVVAQGSK